MGIFSDPRSQRASFQTATLCPFARWAAWRQVHGLLLSRAGLTGAGSSDDVQILPGVDFANHAAEPCAQVPTLPVGTSG